MSPSVSSWPPPFKSGESKDNHRQPAATGLVKKVVLMGTCAAGAAAALITTADQRQATAGGVVTGLCGITAALGVGIALLTNPLAAQDRRRRTRIAAITQPSGSALPHARSDHNDNAMLASTMIQLQQMSMETENQHASEVNFDTMQASASSTHASNQDVDLELLNSYLSEFPGDIQLNQAPIHILRAHLRLETAIDQMSYEDLCEHFGNTAPAPQDKPGIQDTVNALPSTTVVRALPESEGSTFSGMTFPSSSQCIPSMSCAICLERFEEGDSVRMLPQCGHCYHVLCVDRWLLGYKENCPVCRCVI